MRVRCPECSREYDVEDKNLGKSLKCLCGEKFKAEPVIARDSNTPTDDSFYEDEAKDTDFSLVDGEMSDFISNLKKNRDSFKKEKAIDDPDDIPLVEGMFDPPSLEISENSLEKEKKEDSTISSKILEVERAPEREEPFSPSTNPDIEAVKDKGVPLDDFQRISSPREAFHDEKSLSRKVSSLVHHPSKRFYIISGSLFALGLVITFASLNVFEQEEDEADPYLTKLLSPQEKRDQRREAEASSSAVVSRKDDTSPKTVRLPTEKSTQKRKAPPSQKNSKAALYQSLRAQSLAGDFENVVRLASQTPSLGPEAKSLFFEALAHRAGSSARRQAQVRSELEDAIREFTNSSALRRAQMAQMVIPPDQDRAHYQKAMRALNNLALTRPKDPFVQAYLGLSHFRLGALKKAERAWSQALYLEPQYRWVLLQLYEVQSLQGEFSNALQTALKLEKITGAKREALILMARARANEKKFRTADSLYRKALRVSDSAVLRLEKGQNLLNFNHSRAAQEFRAGLRKTNDIRVKRDLYFGLGRVYCKKADYRSADRHFRNAFSQDRTYVQALFESGNCAYRGKHYRRAAKAYEAVLKAQPKNAEAWYAYGISLKNSDKVRAAAGALERAVGLKPTYRSHYELSLVLMQLGRRQEASTHAYRAYRLNPESKNAKALLTKLR